MPEETKRTVWALIGPFGDIRIDSTKDGEAIWSFLEKGVTVKSTRDELVRAAAGAGITVELVEVHRLPKGG